MWYCRIWFNLVFGVRALTFNAQFFTDSAAKPYISGGFTHWLCKLCKTKTLFHILRPMPKNKAHKKCTCDQKSILKCLVKGQTYRETRPPTPAGATKGQTIISVLLVDIQAPAAEQRGAADGTFRQQRFDAHSILVTQPYRDSSWPTILRAVSRSHHVIRDGSGPNNP